MFSLVRPGGAPETRSRNTCSKKNTNSRRRQHAYTKSDWQLWAAATSGAGTRARIVAALAAWLRATPAPLPFSDLYETVGAGGPPVTPDPITFRARPVVGGHFALLALLRTGQTAAVDAGDTAGSLFEVGGTNALGAPARGV